MTILQIRRHTLYRTGSLILCGAQLMVLLGGCSVPSAPHLRMPRGSVRGEDLFRGIFFGQGEVAAEIPGLRDMAELRASLAPSQRTALDDFVDQLVIAIRQTAPGHFQTFATEIQSGDQVRISRVLDQTEAITMAALDRIPDVANWRARLAENRQAVQAELIRQYNAGRLDEDDLHAARAKISLFLATNNASSEGATDDGDPALKAMKKPGWAIVVVIAVAAAVAVPPVLAAAIAVVFAYAYYFPGPAKGPESLRREQIVNDLVMRLRAAPTAGANH